MFPYTYGQISKVWIRQIRPDPHKSYGQMSDLIWICMPLNPILKLNPDCKVRVCCSLYQHHVATWLDLLAPITIVWATTAMKPSMWAPRSENITLNKDPGKNIVWLCQGSNTEILGIDHPWIWTEYQNSLLNFPSSGSMRTGPGSNLY